jgi:4-hydroxybenzoate polyprenyltransferase
LNECGTDAAAERAAGLRTIPALLGRRGTTWAAGGLWALAFAASCGLRVVAPSAGAIGDRFLAMTTWYGAVTGAANGVFLVLSSVRHEPLRWDRSVDVAFWVLRIVPFVALLGALRCGAEMTAR